MLTMAFIGVGVFGFLCGIVVATQYSVSLLRESYRDTVRSGKFTFGGASYSVKPLETK